MALLKDSHREAVITAHFTACDWIRELINAFVLEPDHETKSKVILTRHRFLLAVTWFKLWRMIDGWYLRDVIVPPSRRCVVSS